MKKIVIIFVAVMIVLLSLLLMAFKKENKLISDITFEQISLKNIKDGNYLGDYKTNFIHVQVDVKMKNNLIESITLLKHDNGKGQDAEMILPNIVDAQSTDVDTISGATGSSKVMIKAVENALLKASSGSH